MSYPPVATVTLYGEDCVRVELYESGFLLVTAVSAPNLPAACQPPQPDDATAEQPEMIRLAGENVMAEKWTGPLYQVTLPDGLRIEYGLLPNVAPNAIDSQAALAVIGDMLDSIRFTQATILAQVTPTPIPAGCLDDNPATAPAQTGRLRVVFEANGQMWEWREETGTAVQLEPEATPLNEIDGKLSADGQFLASLRQPDENTFELWVSAADGSNLRQLVVISPDEVYERYPQATAVRLEFGWIGTTSLISYHFSPEFDGIGGVPLQTIWIVDSESGRSWIVLPPDELWAYQFVNSGHQVIVLGAEGVRVIDTIDGGVRFDIPLDVVVPFEQRITFTPNNERIIVYTTAGITFIKPDDGTFIEIPLDYMPIGAGHYSILPPLYWLENETQFYTQTTTDEDWTSPEATFTIWVVDTEAASATPLHTFTGFYPSVVFSPDRRWIAFWPQRMDNLRQLYLADLSTGKQFLYDTLRLLEFIDWSPDGTQFLYKEGQSTQPILGHICAAPRPVTGIEVNLNGDVKWVDGQRLLILDGSPEDGQPRQLRLVTLDGQSTLIATLNEDYPPFRFYFEE
jgi:hypothetical protein